MTEAFDEAGCEFGEERLATALCRNKTLPAPALLGAVLQEVQRFSPQEQHDDITLLVAKCSGAADLQGKLY
jgi:serine phosphatase RsbU (regulator of sigma subunit)